MNENNNQKHLNENDKEEFGDKLLDHDYDGIRELDNSLPPWWVILFYITINFSIIYAVLFFAVGIFDQKDELASEFKDAETALVEYQQEQARLRAANTSANAVPVIEINENNVKLDTSSASIANGQKVYTSLCASCHRLDGGGGIGPNLTDSYWLHGSDFREVFSLIKYGIPEKGMIAWRTQLSPEEIKDVTSYLYTMLKDNNVAEGKEPQGVKEY